MFSGGFRGQKLKTSLRLSINRLKLMEKKKSKQIFYNHYVLLLHNVVFLFSSFVCSLILGLFFYMDVVFRNRSNGIPGDM